MLQNDIGHTENAIIMNGICVKVPGSSVTSGA
jgi:hypothetical protein